MLFRVRTIVFILMFSLLIYDAGVFMRSGTADSYASETDRIKAITVFTDFNMPGYGDIKTDVGLDTLVSPADASGYEITWESSNTDIAVVDDRGHVHAVLAGEYADKDEAQCTITATVSLNGMTASDSVTVNAVRPDNSSGLLSAHSSASSENTTGELLVCFDASCSNKEISSIVTDHDAACEKITRAPDGTGVALASLSDSSDTKDMETITSGLENEKKVEFVQPNYIYTLDSEEPDPKYNQTDQYFHFQTGINKAWDIIAENKEAGADTACTTVAVLDSGVDTTHSDLVSADATNLILKNGKYISFRDGTEKEESADHSLSGHGTHVTGIISALYGNGTGGAGAASGKSNDLAKTMVIGITDSSDYTDTYDIISAIDHAAENGARVINMSFGGESYDRALDDTISGWYSRGVVFVASAGNDNSDYSSDPYSISYPSDLSEVISVCNINKLGARYSSSNYGFAKDISAPGTGILSTKPGNKMGTLSGTSMSAPVISSVCALILDAHPDLTPGEVRNILCGTTSDPDNYYTEKEIGYGIVDAAAAVRAAYSARTASPDNISISIKKPYRGKPDRVITTTSVKAAFTAPSRIRQKGLKKAAWIGLNRSTCTFTETTTVETRDAYTDRILETTSDTVTRKTKSGVKYRIGIKKKGGSWKYYTVPALTRSRPAYKAAVSGDRVKVKIKRLKSRQTYYIRVRPLKKINGTVKYGKWTASKKIVTK